MVKLCIGVGPGRVSTPPKGFALLFKPVTNRARTQFRASPVAESNVSHHSDASNGAAERRSGKWDRKSDVYILRSDGFSCARETVTSDGSLQFEHPSSQQQLLVWKSRPKCVMLLKKLGNELMTEMQEVLRYCGEDQGLRVLVEPHDYEVLKVSMPEALPYLDTWTPADVPELHCYVDFVVCLGGDGLILHASYLFGDSMPPVISFKLGSLGFLTSHSYEEFRDHIDNVVNGSEELETCRLTNSIDGSPLTGVYITLRMRLLCQVFRNGRIVDGGSREVLNEVVLSRGANPYLSKIEVYERETMITKVQADGVMLATPTGSTAYSVAAGGSMVHPNVPAILFTPICPHSLSFRPVILPDSAQIVLKIADEARCGAVATFDGQATVELIPGDEVHVRLSLNPVPTINNLDQTVDWFSSIERCFNWNDRLEQKELKTLKGSRQGNGSDSPAPSTPVGNQAALSARVLSSGKPAPGSV